MIGETIDDRYDIEALIGRGGMGTVYRATDLIEKRPVALKVLHYFLDKETEVALTRFRREFRVLARLDHPGIVRAFGFGTYSGSPYLVLEFLAGHTLAEELAAGPLARAHLLLIARQICQALVHLHAQSIVHRDLKPGNLMLLPTDETLQIKLMDFGLVRQANLSMQLTQEGMALGTVAYMAPEQAQGFPVDFRADLYALGVILYEMTTGRPPFIHENPAMVLMQQLTSSPLSPRELNPDLDEPLTRLILQLLAKEPAQRPAGTELVATRLAQLADETAPRPALPQKRVDLVPRIPLIGRESALNELAQHWARVQGGQGTGRGGRIVLLAGAAGTGKTRLLDEMFCHCGPGLLVGDDLFLRGQCREQASLPYQPLDEVLDILLRQLPASVRDTLPVELAQLLLAASPNGSEHLQSGTPHAGSDQAEARLRLFAACWEVLQRAAQPRTLMIALEDLQWADPTTLELLGYLAHRLEQVRVLLVLTYRPEEVQAGAPLATFQHNLQRDRLDHTITLDVLNRNQVADFLRAALGREQIPTWLVNSFHQATDGNPLFIEETLKALAAEGRVAQWARQKSSRWRKPPSVTLQLPQSVLALAERRLQLLSPTDRPILTTAAVLGPEFSFAVLQGVTKLDEDTLLDAVDRLLATHLIVELPLQDGEDRYRFAQEALRQTLLTAISRRRLRSLHRRSGETIQALYDTGQPRRWPVLAYHFAEAGDKPRALKYYTLAADAAVKVYANAEAAGHYSRALEIATAEMERGEVIDSEQLIHLYTNRGLSLELNIQYEEAWSNYGEMATLAHERGDHALELAALLGQARARFMPTPLHDFDQAKTLSKKALALACTLGNQQAEAKALENLMGVYSITGRYSEAIEYGERSLAIARELNLPEQMAFTLTHLESAYVATSRIDQALAALQEAGQIWRTLGNSFMLAINLSVSSIRYAFGGNYELALNVAEEACHLGQSTGNLWAQAYSKWGPAQVYLEYGQLDKMNEAMNDIIRLGDRADLIPLQIFARADLAWMYGTFGAVEQGLELVRLAQTRAEELLPDWRLYPIVVMAWLHLCQGDLSAAGAKLEESRDIPRTEPNSALQVDMWSALIEGGLALAKQDYEQVITDMDRFVALLRRMKIRSAIAAGLHLKGQALLAQGRLNEAYQVLTNARAESEALGSRHGLWPVLSTLSQIETQRGNLAAAESLRKQAREIIEFIAAHTPPDLRASFLAWPQVRLVLGDT
jgi:predicted ATPase/tRNA A-37 threonylcarbamoyl transferase component Bud32